MGPKIVVLWVTVALGFTVSYECLGGTCSACLLCYSFGTFVIAHLTAVSCTLEDDAGIYYYTKISNCIVMVKTFCYIKGREFLAQLHARTSPRKVWPHEIG
jgi:hypothetical protein